MAQTISNIVVRMAKMRAASDKWHFIAAWLDNFVVSAETKEECNKLKASLDEIFATFGIRAHKWESANDTAILGLHFDAGAARHPQAFIEKASRLFSQSKVSALQFAQLAGCAIWIMMCRDLPIAFIPEIILQLKQNAPKLQKREDWFMEMDLSTNLIHEIDKVSKVMLEPITKPKKPVEAPSIWMSDATQNAVAICCGDFSDAQKTTQTNIFTNELEAAAWALVEAARTSSNCVLGVDNAGVLWALRAQHSALASADFRIATLFAALPTDFFFRVVHVRSEDNAADPFSRGSDVHHTAQRNSFLLEGDTAELHPQNV